MGKLMTREELNQDKQKEIINEEHRETRKKIIIVSLKVIFIVMVLFISFYLYATYISTGSLIVKEKRIINSKIPDSFNGLKIIHFTDLHYGSTILEKDVDGLVKTINKRKPDIVVFTGDLVDNNYDISTKEQEKLTEQLQEIDATLGKYAVVGDEDGENFVTILNQSGFTILNNDYELIYENNNTPILLVGLSSYLKSQTDVEKAYSYFNEPTHNSNIYTISLVHEPDAILDVVNKYPTDLFLAGHSHNGTIRIPYVGALKKVEGAEEYDQAFYKLNDSELYISSGIGTKDPGFRLFCRPSINFFRLSKD